jgi:hypothetical protein
MSHSSHKLRKEALALIHAIQAGIQPPLKQNKKNRPAKIISINPPKQYNQAFSVVHGGRQRSQALQGKTISERTSGIHPVYNRKILELFLYDDLCVDCGSRL